MSSIVKILLLIGTTVAMELPGKCPIVPPTHFPKLIRHYREIVLGVPFSIERPSHLFKAFDSINLLGFLSLSISENSPDTLRITYDDSKFVVHGNLTTYDTTNDKSLCLTSFLTKTFTVCQGTLTEEIRMWFEGDFLIIWSCANNDTNYTHDEAVLFVVEQADVELILYHKSPLEYRKMMQKLKVTVRKYLSDSLLLDTIDWNMGIENKTGNLSYAEFQCLEVPQKSISKGPFQVLFLNLISISIFMFLAVGISGFKDNRVKPVTVNKM